MPLEGAQRITFLRSKSITHRLLGVFAGNATGALEVNTKLKLTGHGMKVGIIDSGAHQEIISR